MQAHAVSINAFACSLEETNRKLNPFVHKEFQVRLGIAMLLAMGSRLQSSCQFSCSFLD